MKKLLSAFALAAALTAVSAFAGTHDKAAEPVKISHGEKVTLADYVVTGKTTIFDFSSEYCPPCRAIAPRLEELHKKRDDIAVVTIDINRPGVRGIDWKSPVAGQYGLRSIPHFKIYSPEGKLIAEGDKAAEQVYGWVE
jgi:thiol-disulfide isomerase/thioredoxin